MKYSVWETASRGGIFLAVLVSIIAGGCSKAAPVDGSEMTSQPSTYSTPEMVGKIETDEIKESSGLSASACQDVLWTHNDAGSGAFIFGMTMQGRHLGTWKVQNAQNVDWEAIASYKDAGGKCFLLIGDIGDNDEIRSELTIYRIPEPQVMPEGASSNTKDPLQTAPAEALKFSYLDSPNNAETMLVHPKTGDIYIVTKKKKGQAAVHKLESAFGLGPVTRTEKIAELSVPSDPPGLFTDGSMSPDGNRVILCDVKSGYELASPAGGSDADAIWKQKPVTVFLGDRKQGEGVTYAPDGRSLYASSEKKNAPIYRISRRAGE